MKKILISAVACCALGTTVYGGKNVVVAETEVAPVLGSFYVGAGYSSLKLDTTYHYDNPYYDDAYDEGYDNSYSVDDQQNGWMVLAGYEFMENLAVEARYTKINEEFALDEKTLVDYSNIAIYLKPQFKLGALTLYGLIGYGSSSFDVWGTSHDDTDMQYGAGLSYNVTENFAVFADYTVLYDEDSSDVLGAVGDASNDVKVDSFNLGATYRF